MILESNATVRILVIDDEAIVGKRLKQILEKMGFEVVVEISAPPALKKMAEQPFNIVITDLKMKDMDGMEVLAQVKLNNPATKVIIITGYAEQETANQAYQEGVYDFIAKPFRLDELKQVVLRALEDQQPSSAMPSGAE